MDLVQKGLVAGNKATVFFLWRAALRWRNHFCIIHGNRKPGHLNLERAVLDYSIIYQYQRRSQKFFAGKQV